MARVFRSSVPDWLLALSLTLPLAGCFEPAETSRFAVAIQGLYDAQLSTDGRYLLAASINQGGSFWDLMSKARRFNWNHQAGEQTVLAVVGLAGNASLAITVDQVPIMVLWNPQSGQALKSWMLTHQATSLALADRGGRLLIGSANNEAVLFDLIQGGIDRRLPHNGEVNDVAITPDGRLGLTVADDEFARLWDLDSGEPLHRWELDNKGITAALSADGRYAFAAAQSARAAVWNTQTGKALFELNPFQHWMDRGVTYSSAVFSPTANELLTGSMTGAVKRWSLKTGKPIASWQLGRQDALTPSAVKLMALAYGPNRDYIAVGSNGLVYTLDNKRR